MVPLFINFNGDIHPADSKLVAVNNRAFKYGDGLFESMCMGNGKLMFVHLHADRLQRGMEALKIEGSNLMDTWFLKNISEDIAIRNKTKHGRLRLTVFRDAAGLYTPSQNKNGWCLEIEPLDEPPYILNSRGLIMDIFTELPKPNNYLSNIKTCNSLIYVMAGIFKKQK